MSGDEAEWHCKQLPNGANPIVVCERAVLLAEVERLCAEVERLRAEVQEKRVDVGELIAQIVRRDDEIVRLRAAGDALADMVDEQDAIRLIAAWEEARRG